MFIEVPQGAKNITLENGFIIEVPQGAKSIEVPDSLFKKEKKAKDIVFSKEELEAFKNNETLNRKTVPKDNELEQGLGAGLTPIDTIVDFAFNNEEKKAKKKKEEATKILSDIQNIQFANKDLVDMVKGFTGDKEALKQIQDKALQTSKALADTLYNLGFNDVFVSSDGKVKYKDDTGKTQIVGDEFWSSFKEDILNNKMEILGDIAGGYVGYDLGKRYAEKAKIGGWRGTAAKVLGGIGGAALGALYGRSQDVKMSKNNLEDLFKDLERSSKLDEIIETNPTLLKALDAANMTIIGTPLAAGLVSGAVKAGSLIVKGGKKVIGYGDGLVSKLGGSEEILKQDLGVNDRYIKEALEEAKDNYKEVGKYIKEDKKTRKREELLATVLKKGNENLIEEALKDNETGAINLAKTISKRADNVSQVLEEHSKGISGEDIKKYLKEYENKTKMIYSDMRKNFNKAFENSAYRFKLEDLAVNNSFLDMSRRVQDPDAESRFIGLQKYINNTFDKDTGLEKNMDNLLDLRQQINKFYSKNEKYLTNRKDKETFSQIKSNIDTEIYKAIDNNVLDDELKTVLKDDFSTAINRYKEFAKLEDNKVYKAITKEATNSEDRIKSLVKHMKDDDSYIEDVLNKMTSEARQNTEVAILRDLANKYTFNPNIDKKAIAFEDLGNELKSIRKNIKSDLANETIDNLIIYSEKFSNNDVLFLDLARGIRTSTKNNIATTIRGKAQMGIMSAIFKFFQAIPPTEIGKRLALQRNLKKALTKSRTPQEFAIKISQMEEIGEETKKTIKHLIENNNRLLRVKKESEIERINLENEEIIKEQERIAILKQYPVNADNIKRLEDLEDFYKAHNEIDDFKELVNLDRYKALLYDLKKYGKINRIDEKRKKEYEVLYIKLQKMYDDIDNKIVKLALEYKPNQTGIRNYDIEKIQVKSLAKQEGMDEKRIERINNFEDLFRERKDFKTEQSERRMGNMKNPVNSENMLLKDEIDKFKNMPEEKIADEEIEQGLKQEDEILKEEEKKKTLDLSEIEYDDKYTIIESLKIPQINIHKTDKNNKKFFLNKTDFLQNQEATEDISININEILFNNNFDLANKIFPTFQGAKKEVASVMPEIVKGVFKQNERANIDTIWDYFGGSGSWSLFLANNNLFPNLKQINIVEFSPLRKEKIEYTQNHYKEMINYYKSKDFYRFLNSKLREENQKGKNASGTALANRFLWELKNKEYPKLEQTAIYNLVDYFIASFESKNNTGAEGIIKNLNEKLENIGKITEKLKEKGVKINYLQADSYKIDYETGANVLALVDPPYLKTKGYSYIDLEKNEIKSSKIVGVDTYVKTYEMYKKLKESGNNIIYTDEAYYRLSPYGEKDVGEYNIIEGYNKNAYGLTKDMIDISDLFFELPVANRTETIGIIKSKDFNIEKNIKTENFIEIKDLEKDKINKKQDFKETIKKEEIDYKKRADELNENPPSFEELKALERLSGGLNFSQNVFIPLRKSEINEYGAKLYFESLEKYKEKLPREIDKIKYPINETNIKKLEELRDYFLSLRDSKDINALPFDSIVNPQQYKALLYDLKKYGKINRSTQKDNEKYEEIYIDLQKVYNEFSEKIKSFHEDENSAEIPF